MEDEELMIFIRTMQVAILALYTARSKKASVGKTVDDGYPKIKAVEYGDFATLFSELKEDLDLFFIFVSFQVITVGTSQNIT